MEGVYRLARLLGPAFAAPSRLVHATSVFEEGWLIVQAQYYKLEQVDPLAAHRTHHTAPISPCVAPLSQVSERGYRLLPEKRYLVVNSLVRLKGLEFSRTQGGPQQRSLRGSATGPAAAARKQGVGGLSFFSEDMHNTVLGACEAADEASNAMVEADLYGADGQLLNPAPDIEYDDEA